MTGVMCGAELWEGGVFITQCTQPPDHPGWTMPQDKDPARSVTKFKGWHGDGGAPLIVWCEEPKPKAWYENEYGAVA